MNEQTKFGKLGECVDSWVLLYIGGGPEILPVVSWLSFLTSLPAGKCYSPMYQIP